LLGKQAGLKAHASSNLALSALLLRVRLPVRQVSSLPIDMVDKILKGQNKNRVRFNKKEE
jgi:hypothetical protein